LTHLDRKEPENYLGLRSLPLPDVASENDRRLGLWKTLTSDNIENIEPKQLRDLRIYGGAQGIWVDKGQTTSSELGVDGATVSVLHTGRHYADDLSDDGVIYHYPQTSRPPARDAAEVQATKNAMLHKLPIFIILPGKSSQSLRSVKIGWVCDFDDTNRQFLILFGQETPPTYTKAEHETDPFRLTEEPRKKAAAIKNGVKRRLDLEQKEWSATLVDFDDDPFASRFTQSSFCNWDQYFHIFEAISATNPLGEQNGKPNIVHIALDTVSRRNVQRAAVGAGLCDGDSFATGCGWELVLSWNGGLVESSGSS
jgi:hypothetical protein